MTTTPTSSPEEAAPPAAQLPSPLSPEFLKTVSHGPGVYLMLGKSEVLYVGKALDLRKRLASYVHHKGAVHSKTTAMLAKVRRVETILTTTEKEALILEASLIKKHRPRYNVILRDDKNYPLIKVSVKDQWPRITVTRKRLRDGNRYFGPYAATTAMRTTLHLLHTLFPLRRCKQVRERKRPCLNFQMGRCLAPCAGLVQTEAYEAMVRDALLLLEGRNREMIALLTDRMREAAAHLAYEKAARYRDQIRALETTLERQVIAAEHHADQDVFGFAREGGSAAVAILFIRGGMVNGFQRFFLAEPLDDDGEILSSTIMQYYSSERQPPGEILLPFAPDDADLLAERLGELREASCRLLTPQRGKLRQLMEMAAGNARQVFAEEGRREKSWQSLAGALQKHLHLHRSPERIECLDISNTLGKQAVGSLVSFFQGEKHSPGFRHYRIQGKDSPDDYAMMHEVLTRRMLRGLEKNDLPDLLLLDGGKGQLGIALQVMEELGMGDAPELASIAKEKENEGEKLFRPGRKNPILLPAHSPALLYLMRIRDEAHRFGITTHRRLRGGAALHSRLDELQGVGPKRKQLLLQHFGSLTRLLAANIEELAAVPGLGPTLAASLRDQLHEAAERKE